MSSFQNTCWRSLGGEPQGVSLHVVDEHVSQHLYWRSLEGDQGQSTGNGEG